MDRAEMIALASPPCRQCGEPVQRIEQRWHRDGDGEWRLGPTFMVCAEGHRTWMEPLDAADP